MTIIYSISKENHHFLRIPSDRSELNNKKTNLMIRSDCRFENVGIELILNFLKMK